MRTWAVSSMSRSLTASSSACISASTSSGVLSEAVSSGAATAARIFNGPAKGAVAARVPRTAGA